MSILAQNVWVERDGEAICFTAGSTPPAWATALITNPKAWAEAGIPVELEDEPEDDSDGDESGGASDESEEETEAGSEEEPADVPIPPKGGPGSSAAAWAVYALSKGFEVDGDAKSSEIREALAEAGIPVE